MTNMSDVSEVIETVEAVEGDLVSRTLALVEAPEALEIKPFLDKPVVTGEGEIIGNITPIAYPVRDFHIAQLHKLFDGVQLPVATAEGMKDAKRVKSGLTKLKTAMKDAYQTWNAPIMEMTADARAKRDYVIEQVDSILAPIAEQIDAQTKIENEERARKAAEESKRIEAHTAAVKVLQDMPGKYLSESSETITKVIAEISSFDYLTRRNWQEYLPAATDAIRTSIETLNQHLENAKAREDVARLRAEQEEARRKQEHAAALTERIHNIELAPNSVVGATSEAIRRMMARLDQTDVSTFDDKAAEATAAIENTRNTLQTMLDAALANEETARQAAADAAELATFRAAAVAQKKAQEEAQERAERETREAAETAEREAAEQAQREKDEAARIARERAEAHAETLLALVVESRPYVDQSENFELLGRIDTAIAAAKGE